MRAAAPIVNSIRDSSMRPEYIRTVAGWIGVEVEQVQAEVSRAQRMAARDAKEAATPAGATAPGSTSGPATPAHRPDADSVPEPSLEEARAALPAPDLRDPIVFAERQLLQTLLQYPDSFAADDVDKVSADAFTAPAHRAVFDGVRGAGGPQRGLSVQAWADRVTQAAPLAVHGLVAELAVASLPTRFDKATGLPERRYIDALLIRVQEVSLTRRIADAMSAMRRMATDPHTDPAAGPLPQRRAAGAPARARDRCATGPPDGALAATPRPGCPPTVRGAARARVGRAGAQLGTGRRPAAPLWWPPTTACMPSTPAGERTLARPWHEVDGGTWSAELTRSP